MAKSLWKLVTERENESIHRIYNYICMHNAFVFSPTIAHGRWRECEREGERERETTWGICFVCAAWIWTRVSFKYLYLKLERCQFTQNAHRVESLAIAFQKNFVSFSSPYGRTGATQFCFLVPYPREKISSFFRNLSNVPSFARSGFPLRARAFRLTFRGVCIGATRVCECDVRVVTYLSLSCTLSLVYLLDNTNWKFEQNY